MSILSQCERERRKTGSERLSLLPTHGRVQGAVDLALRRSRLSVDAATGRGEPDQDDPSISGIGDATDKVPRLQPIDNRRCARGGETDPASDLGGSGGTICGKFQDHEVGDRKVESRELDRPPLSEQEERLSE